MQAERQAGAMRTGLMPWYQGVAFLFTVLMIIQAFLGGRGLFEDLDLLDAHMMLGSVLFLVVIVQVVLAYLAVGARGATFWMSVALLVLVVIQMMLGFSATNEDHVTVDANAAAWHIPVGVLIFGIGTSHNAMLYRRTR